MPFAGRAAKIAFLSLLALPLLAPNAHAGTTSCIIGGSGSFSGCLSSSIPLALIGILVSFLLLGITYMVGEVIGSSSLKGWYKNELREIIKSLLIIAIIYSLIVIASGIAVTLSGGTAASGSGSVGQNINGLYNSANGYITTQLNNVESAYDFVTGVAYGTDFLKSISYSVWFPFPIFPPIIFASFQSGSSGSLYSSSLIDSRSAAKNLSFLKDSYNFIIVPMLFVFQAQSTLLLSIIDAGLLIFIPGGILLRAIPFLRGLGGTLLAIGVALSLLYPTVLVTINTPISNFMSGIVSQPISAGCSINGAGPFGWLIDIALGVFCSVETVAVYSVGVGAGLSGIVSIYPAFNGIFSYIFPLVVQFVLFVLDIIIVYTIAQEIAKMLGGTLRLGFGKFKLA